MCRAYDFLSIDEERKSMYFQLDRCKEYLRHLPVAQLKLENTEADDIIAWVSHYYKDEEVIIISTDKDFYQLINDHVKVFNPITKKLFSCDEIYSKFGIMPKNFVLARALDGDKSDDVTGINGIGLKTAIKMFPILNDDVRLFPVDLIEYAQNIGINKNKRYQKIIDESSKVEINYKIMQLRDPLISSPQIAKMIDILGHKANISVPKVRSMFIADQLWSQIKNFDDWVLNFVPLKEK